MQEDVFAKCFQLIDSQQASMSKTQRARAGVQLMGGFPTIEAIEDLCSTTSGEYIQEEEFRSISNACTSLSPEILEILFSSLDGHQSGFVMLEDLRDACEKFEESLDFEELEQHFLQTGCCRGGKLYYHELIKIMMEDKQKVHQKLLSEPESRALDKAESVSSMQSDSPAHKSDSETTAKSSDAETSDNDNSSSGTEEPGPSTSGALSSEKQNSDELDRLKAHQCFKLKGCFLNDEEEPDASKKLVSHQFDIYLTLSGEYTITMEPYCPGGGDRTNGEIDTLFFVANVSGDVIGFSDAKYSEGLFSYKCDLIEGSYRILPFTTGCRFKASGTDDSDRVELLETSDGRYRLTKMFRMALMNMLEICDLDGNGCLSRSEFNLFNIRTGDEHVTDEEWFIVQQNFSCRDGELTLKGFVEMHELEANESNGDTEDMWLSLRSMGFNNKLQLVDAVPFILSIYCTSADNFPSISFAPQEIQPLQQSWLDAIVDYWGRESFVWQSEGGVNIRIARYDWLAVALVQNQTDKSVCKELGVTVHEDVTCRFVFGNVVTVEAESTIVAAFFLPDDGLENWNFDIAFE